MGDDNDWKPPPKQSAPPFQADSFRNVASPAPIRVSETAASQSSGSPASFTGKPVLSPESRGSVPYVQRAIPDPKNMVRVPGVRAETRPVPETSSPQKLIPISRGSGTPYLARTSGTSSGSPMPKNSVPVPINASSSSSRIPVPVGVPANAGAMHTPPRLGVNEASRSSGSPSNAPLTEATRSSGMMYTPPRTSHPIQSSDSPSSALTPGTTVPARSSAESPLSTVPPPERSLSASSVYSPSRAPVSAYTPVPQPDRPSATSSVYSPSKAPVSAYTPVPQPDRPSGASSAYSPSKSPVSAYTPVNGASSAYSPSKSPVSAYTPVNAASSVSSPSKTPVSAYTPVNGASSAYSPSKSPVSAYTPVATTVPKNASGPEMPSPLGSPPRADGFPIASTEAPPPCQRIESAPKTAWSEEAAAVRLSTSDTGGQSFKAHPKPVLQPQRSVPKAKALIPQSAPSPSSSSAAEPVRRDPSRPLEEIPIPTIVFDEKSSDVEPSTLAQDPLDVLLRKEASYQAPPRPSHAICPSVSSFSSATTIDGPDQADHRSITPESPLESREPRRSLAVPDVSKRKSDRHSMTMSSEIVTTKLRPSLNSPVLSPRAAVEQVTNEQRASELAQLKARTSELLSPHTAPENGRMSHFSKASSHRSSIPEHMTVETDINDNLPLYPLDGTEINRTSKGYPAIMENYPDFRRRSQRMPRTSYDPFNQINRAAILTSGVIPTPTVTPSVQAMNLGRNARRHSDILQRHASSRIDPEQIPRPSTRNSVAVKDEGGKMYETDKYTNPPPVDSVCRILDKGSASCRFIRMTTNQVPVLTSTANQSHVIIGCVLQPFAELGPNEYPISVVDPGGNGPFRCSRCGCYVNAYFTWTNAGRDAVCNFCKHTMRAPPEYLCALDENGRRRDYGDRVELLRGTVDYVAPDDYSDFKPTVPAYIFLVDCTQISIGTKFMQCIFDAIRKLLDFLPSEDTEICLVTFDSSIYFYQLEAEENDAKPAKLMIVNDMDRPFAPAGADKLLFNPRTDTARRANFDTLMTTVIPKLFDKTTCDVHCGHAALRACMKLLASRGGGQILFCTSSMPKKGLGKLQFRDDMPMYSSSPRSSQYAKMFQPQHPELFKKWAAKSNKGNVSVDLFLVARPNAYVDVASMGYIPRKTGGYVHLYRHFDYDTDGEKLGYDIARTCVPKVTAFGCILRVRTSIGLSVDSCYAACEFEDNTAVVAKISTDTSFGLVFQLNDKLESFKHVHVQVACLYTNVHGQRLIRVHTLQVQTTSSLSNTFKHTCIDTYANILLKRIAASVLAHDTGWRKKLERECINVLYAYRVNCSTSTQIAQLILPESLKMLPLFISTFFKMPCFRQQSSEIRIDQRIVELLTCLSAPVAFTQCWIYPRVFPIHNLTDKVGTNTGVKDNVHLPAKIAASMDKVTADGAYIVDNGWHVCLFLGAEVSNVFLKDVFDIHELAGLSPGDIQLVPEEGHLSERIYAIVEQIRKDKGSHPWLPLKVVLPNSSEESRFFRLLVEDRFAGELSYVDYLCKIHKAVQEQLD